MARILITGSADGLGLLTARRLIDEGHLVTLHARSNNRAHEALRGAPEAVEALVADLSSLSQVRRLAAQANARGRFDAVIHNAAIGPREPSRSLTEDGLEHVFAVNVLAPYLLTTLMDRPRRLIYMTSGRHRDGNPDLRDLSWSERAWDGPRAYADSKLCDLLLAMAVARCWPEVICNAVEPGWVPTRLGGPDAPEDVGLGADTQAWLAVSEERAARVSGRCLYHRAERATHPIARHPGAQDRLLETCAGLTGERLPVSVPAPFASVA
ncbi:MAG: SDR family NAD(P)-dependent oxidoreductase [Solirubrobacteraceae bacterium]